MFLVGLKSIHFMVLNEFKSLVKVMCSKKSQSPFIFVKIKLKSFWKLLLQKMTVLYSLNEINDFKNY